MRQGKTGARRNCGARRQSARERRLRRRTRRRWRRAADPLAAVKAELSAEVALLAPRFAHALPKVAMPGDKAPAFTAANFVGKIIEYTQAFVGADSKVAAKYRWVHSFAPAPTTLQQFGAET